MKKITAIEILNSLVINATKICIEKHIPAHMRCDRFDFESEYEQKPIFPNVTSILLRYSAGRADPIDNERISRQIENVDEFKAEVETAFEKDVASLDERLNEILKVDENLKRGMNNWRARKCAEFFIKNQILPRIRFLDDHIYCDIETNRGDEVRFACSRIRRAVRDIGWLDGCLQYKMETYLKMVEHLERKYRSDLVKNIADDMVTNAGVRDPVYIGIMELAKNNTVQATKTDKVASETDETITTEKPAEQTETNESKGVSTMKKSVILCNFPTSESYPVGKVIKSLKKSSVQRELKLSIYRLRRELVMSKADGTTEKCGSVIYDCLELSSPREIYGRDILNFHSILERSVIKRYKQEFMDEFQEKNVSILEQNPIIVDAMEFVRICKEFKAWFLKLTIDYDTHEITFECVEKWKTGKMKGQLKSAAKFILPFKMVVSTATNEITQEIHRGKELESVTLESMPTAEAIDAWVETYESLKKQSEELTSTNESKGVSTMKKINEIEMACNMGTNSSFSSMLSRAKRDAVESVAGKLKISFAMTEKRCKLKSRGRGESKSREVSLIQFEYNPATIDRDPNRVYSTPVYFPAVENPNKFTCDADHESFKVIEDLSIFVNIDEFAKQSSNCTIFKNLHWILKLNFETHELTLHCPEVYLKGKNRGELKSERKLALKFSLDETATIEKSADPNPKHKRRTKFEMNQVRQNQEDQMRLEHMKMEVITKVYAQAYFKGGITKEQEESLHEEFRAIPRNVFEMHVLENMPTAEAIDAFVEALEEESKVAKIPDAELIGSPISHSNESLSWNWHSWRASHTEIKLYPGGEPIDESYLECFEEDLAYESNTDMTRELRMIGDATQFETNCEQVKIESIPILTDPTFILFEKLFRRHPSRVARKKGKQKKFVWSDENKRRIEKLASDSSNHLRIVTESKGYYEQYFINDMQIFEQEAGYFNFLRYLNDGEYIPDETLRRSKCVTNQIPYFFRDAVYVKTKIGIFEYKSILKPLLAKKLNKLGISSNFIDIDKMFERFEKYYSLIDKIWKMLDARTELYSRLYSNNSARILAREHEDPIQKKQINATRKLIDSLYANKALSVDAFQQIFDAQREKLGCNVVTYTPDVANSPFYSIKPDVVLRAQISEIESCHLKSCYIPLDLKTHESILKDSNKDSIKKASPLELLIDEIKRYCDDNRQTIENDVELLLAREYLFDTINETKAGKIKIESLRSEYRDFIIYVESRKVA